MVNREETPTQVLVVLLRGHLVHSRYVYSVDVGLMGLSFDGHRQPPNLILPRRRILARVHVTISSMPIDQILPLLIAERDKLSRAIDALGGSAKRTGRPPKSAVPSTAPVEAAPKKRHVSAAARRKMAAAQKKRWAAIKAAKK